MYDILGDDIFHITAPLLLFGPAATFGPGGLGTFIASTGILTVILSSSVSVTDRPPRRGLPHLNSQMMSHIH
jgi:hypothetical protein